MQKSILYSVKCIAPNEKIWVYPCMVAGIVIKNKFPIQNIAYVRLKYSFLRFENETNWTASFPNKNLVIIYMYYGLFQKKSKEWGHGISKGIEEHVKIPGIK